MPSSFWAHPSFGSGHLYSILNVYTSSTAAANDPFRIVLPAQEQRSATHPSTEPFTVRQTVFRKHELVRMTLTICPVDSLILISIRSALPALDSGSIAVVP